MKGVTVEQLVDEHELLADGVFVEGAAEVRAKQVDQLVNELQNNTQLTQHRRQQRTCSASVGFALCRVHATTNMSLSHRSDQPDPTWVSAYPYRTYKNDVLSSNITGAPNFLA